MKPCHIAPMSSATTVRKPISFREIQENAEGVLISAGVADIYPVPLEEVATFLGYQCLTVDLEDDFSGAIQYSEKIIYVNSNHSATRQRFTIAHEIAHARLHSHGEEAVIDYRKNIENPEPSNRKEVEANHFAANLLMPKEQFIWVWRDRGGDVKRVAAFFGVSESCASIRAKSLALA